MRKKAILMLGVLILCAGCGSGSGSAAKAPDKAQEAQDLPEAQEAESEAITPADQESTQENESPEAGAEQDEAREEEGREGMRANLTEEQIESERGEDLDASTDDVGAERDLFADFLRGTGSADVSDQILWQMDMADERLESGKTLSAFELAQFLRENSFASDADYSLSYAPLTCSSGLAFALQYVFDSQPETYTVLLVFSERNNELKIVFAGDQWSRRSVWINEYGIVKDSGSGGAGSHYYGTYAPDDAGNYQTVSAVDEEYYGFGFYDESGQPMQELNDVMQEAGEKNEAAQEVVYYQEKIDGREYYYFLGTGKLSQKTVDYIDGIASEHNFRFDGKAAADEARSACEKKLGIEEAVKSEQEPYWKTL